MDKIDTEPYTGAGLKTFANGKARQTPPLSSRQPSTPKVKCKTSTTELNDADFKGLVTTIFRHGEKQYRRNRDLPGLLHLFPAEIDRLDEIKPKAIYERITLALRAERRRGRSGHWRYSLSRHIGLQQAMRAEKAKFHDKGKKHE